MEEEDYKILESKFEEEKRCLAEQLLKDKRILKNDDKERPYKFKTRFYSAALSHYDISNILPLCNDINPKAELKYCIEHDDNPYRHFCTVCGKLVRFSERSYHKTCRSKECLCHILLNNEDIKNKHEYIKEHYLSGKGKFTPVQCGFIEKHGVYMNSQLNAWKEEVKSTWESKTPEELETRRQKTIDTCRKTYGYDFSQQDPEIKKKQIKTWKSKTRKELDIKNQKRINTTLQRYGVDHIMRSKEVTEAAREKYFKIHGCYNKWQEKIRHKDIFFDDEKLTAFIKEENKKRASKGLEIVSKHSLDKFFNYNMTARLREIKGIENIVKLYDSELEKRICGILKDNKIKFERHNRNIIENPKQHKRGHFYELDIYLPDYRIGIEVNDAYTHSFYYFPNILGKKYHLYKTMQCKNKGIRLIHLWEWEIESSFGKISKWLLNEISKSEKCIFARKCKIIKVDTEREKEFLCKYHLQGYVKSSVCYGLEYENELIEVMSFGKPRFDAKYQYELLRLCTKYGYKVTGGSERLFTHFIKDYNPESVISYCDFSKYYGNVYEKIGMKLKCLSAPLVTYFKANRKPINESLLMKYGIDNILNTHYGKNASNKQCMIKENYIPVCNCGNLIYEYKK